MQTKKLMQIAKEIRGLLVRSIASIGSGHIGGSLSIVDLLTVLYFHEMKIDPQNPRMETRDRLVVSKGHAGPGVYAALARRGYFPEEELYTLNKFKTNLPSHCDMNKTIGIDMTTGSLGQGISSAVGMALGSKINNDNVYIYAIIGDGESQEGQVWEAAMFAAHAKLDNLIVFLDFNHLQLDGYLEDINAPQDVVKKWESFGFYTQAIDGHNIDAIKRAIKKAKNYKTTHESKPNMIIMNTVKGKGISFVEAAKASNHSMPISKEQVELALKELGI